MYITEAIERADKLIANEYDIAEKIHWCDVVGAELHMLRKDYKSAELSLWNDNTYLLPEDCEISDVVKVIAAGQEIPKRDMRTNGLFMSHAPGQPAVTVEYGCRTDRLCNNITVVYKPHYQPTRTPIMKAVTAELAKSTVTVILPSNAERAEGDTITLPHNAPFIADDTVKISAEGSYITASILSRELILPEGGTYEDMQCVLTCGEGELEPMGYGTKTVDIERVITDKTLCPPPYDEMYIDYIAAQICFYQRKNDIYQQNIARFNARFDEYRYHLKDTEAENDHTVFTNWWRL